MQRYLRYSTRISSRPLRGTWAGSTCGCRRSCGSCVRACARLARASATRAKHRNRHIQRRFVFFFAAPLSLAAKNANEKNDRHFRKTRHSTPVAAAQDVVTTVAGHALPAPRAGCGQGGWGRTWAWAAAHRRVADPERSKLRSCGKNGGAHVRAPAHLRARGGGGGGVRGLGTGGEKWQQQGNRLQ